MAESKEQRGETSVFYDDASVAAVAAAAAATRTLTAQVNKDAAADAAHAIDFEQADPVNYTFHFSDEAWAQLTTLAHRKQKTLAQTLRDALALETWFQDTRDAGAMFLSSTKGSFRNSGKSNRSPYDLPTLTRIFLSRTLLPIPSFIRFESSRKNSLVPASPSLSCSFSAW